MKLKIIGLAFATIVGGAIAAYSYFNPYDKDGYDANGFDRSGYDRNGYDKEGFDYNGFNKLGFSRSGYDRDGFDKNGFDRKGYKRDGYNKEGLDCEGKSRQYYADYLNDLNSHKEKALSRFNEHEYGYALLDARLVLEGAIKIVIEHKLGKAYLEDTCAINIRVCEEHDLFNKDSDFYDNLHQVRKIVSPSMHDKDAQNEVAPNKVYFAIMQGKDLINVARKELC